MPLVGWRALGRIGEALAEGVNEKPVTLAFKVRGSTAVELIAHLFRNGGDEFRREFGLGQGVPPLHHRRTEVFEIVANTTVTAGQVERSERANR